MDVVVTVPKNFKHPDAPGLIGLADSASSPVDPPAALRHNARRMILQPQGALNA